MKKEMTIQSNVTTNMSISNMWTKTKAMMNKAMSNISNYYSSMIDEKLTNKQTLLIMNAQLAFFFAVMPADCSLTLRFACIAWLAVALIQCKNSGIRTSD